MVLGIEEADAMLVGPGRHADVKKALIAGRVERAISRAKSQHKSAFRTGSDVAHARRRAETLARSVDRRAIERKLAGVMGLEAAAEVVGQWDPTRIRGNYDKLGIPRVDDLLKRAGGVSDYGLDLRELLVTEPARARRELAWTLGKEKARELLAQAEARGDMSEVRTLLANALGAAGERAADIALTPYPRRFQEAIAVAFGRPELRRQRGGVLAVQELLGGKTYEPPQELLNRNGGALPPLVQAKVLRDRRKAFDAEVVAEARRQRGSRARR
jgi:hypothetical protein